MHQYLECIVCDFLKIFFIGIKLGEHVEQALPVSDCRYQYAVLGIHVGTYGVTFMHNYGSHTFTYNCMCMHPIWVCNVCVTSIKCTQCLIENAS